MRVHANRHLAAEPLLIDDVAPKPRYRQKSFHRQGFRLNWRWKSRKRKPSRPKITTEARRLIRRIAQESSTWGVPRIQSELALLGYDIAESTVAKYVKRHPKPPSQTWRTFLDNHVGNIAAIDFFVVPTVRFRLLYCFIVLRLDPTTYLEYYHNSRTHLSLARIAPIPRAVEPPSQGRIIAIPQVGGLHLRYTRVA